MTHHKHPGRQGLTALVLGATLSLCSLSGFAETLDGKEITMSKSKGNCLACHMIADGESPGNMGPPLIAMKQRFPDRERLKAQIWDPTEMNPISAMPPFGKHLILSEAEIDAIVDYLYTL